MNQKRSPHDNSTRIKARMRRFGPAMIAIGALMVLIGGGQFLLTFVSAATSDSFSHRPSFPVLFVILGMPGMLILGFGVLLTQFGFLKEITQYGAQETVPAVTTSVTAIRAAITDDDVPCPECSSPIEPDSKFCSSCGVRIGSLRCSSCESPIESNDRFCNSCGTAIS